MFTDRGPPNYPVAVRRRSLIPHLILGVMTVLVIGAVILGLYLAPDTSVLTVHNGAGEVVTAGQVTGVVTVPTSTAKIAFTYVAPDFGKQTLVSSGGAGRHPSKTIHGPTAKTLLQPVSELLKIPTFTKVGTGSATRYVGQVPASDLVPASEASLVRGQLLATAQVTNGYVVFVNEKINLTTPVGTTKETLRYQLTKVDGWTVPKS